MWEEFFELLPSLPLRVGGRVGLKSGLQCLTFPLQVSEQQPILERINNLADQRHLLCARHNPEKEKRGLGHSSVSRELARCISPGLQPQHLKIPHRGGKGRRTRNILHCRAVQGGLGFLRPCFKTERMGKKRGLERRKMELKQAEVIKTYVIACKYWWLPPPGGGGGLSTEVLPASLLFSQCLLGLPVFLICPLKLLGCVTENSMWLQKSKVAK